MQNARYEYAVHMEGKAELMQDARCEYAVQRYLRFEKPQSFIERILVRVLFLLTLFSLLDIYIYCIYTRVPIRDSPLIFRFSLQRWVVYECDRSRAFAV